MIAARVTENFGYVINMFCLIIYDVILVPFVLLTCIKHRERLWQNPSRSWSLPDPPTRPILALPLVACPGLAVRLIPDMHCQIYFSSTLTCHFRG
jgi:hypothetical protein